MSDVEIKRFDAERLEELAKEQTRIYNSATEKLVDFTPAKTEDVIKRFKREQFDPKRMFYAFKGDKMIGYGGLTGRDKELNLRSVGYPWLDKDTDLAVRDTLYDEMEKQCRGEGTKTMRVFSSDRYPEIFSFFKSKNFQISQEFLLYVKDLEKNNFEIPAGYKFGRLKKEDIPKVVAISKKDPKMKNPLVESDLDQFMESSAYNPDNIVVAEKDGNIVGFLAFNIPPDPKNEYCSFAGITVDPDHQDIEVLLWKELENRALQRNKKFLRVNFYPDSLRLPDAKERGFKLTSKNYQLSKALF